MLERLLPPSIVLIGALTLGFGCSGSEDADPSGFGGKADILDNDEVPTLAASYQVQFVSELDICTRDGSRCDGETTTTVIEGIATVTIEQDGSAVTGTMTPCFIQGVTGGGSMYSTEDDRIPDDLLTRIAPMTMTGELVSIDGQVGVDFSPSALEMGFDRFDLDGDGEPGFAIKAPVGKVHLGARITAQIRALLVDDGSLAGAGRFDADYVVFSDSVPLVNVEKKIKNLLDDILFTDTRHSVIMSPSDATCADLMQ